MSVSENGDDMRLLYFSGGISSNMELFAALTECSHLSLLGSYGSVQNILIMNINLQWFIVWKIFVQERTVTALLV